MVKRETEWPPPPKKYLYHCYLGEQNKPEFNKVLIAHETKTYIHFDGHINWKQRIDKRFESQMRGWHRTEKEALDALFKKLQAQVKSSRARVKSSQANLKNDIKILVNLRKYRKSKQNQ